MRKFRADSIVVATHNAGKLAEFEALFIPLGVSVVSSAGFGLPSPEETGTTFVENARIKAHFAASALDRPALADDSGLTIDALDGAPGVYTADWAEGPNGRDFPKAMQKTYQKLLEVAAPEPWSAQFRCTLVLAWPDGHDEVFSGCIDGRIVWPMRGQIGHGFDPIFQPNNLTQTFAELTDVEKNTISHRAIAIRSMINGCFT